MFCYLASCVHSSLRPFVLLRVFFFLSLQLFDSYLENCVFGHTYDPKWCVSRRVSKEIHAIKGSLSFAFSNLRSTEKTSSGGSFDREGVSYSTICQKPDLWFLVEVNTENSGKQTGDIVLTNNDLKLLL